MKRFLVAILVLAIFLSICAMAEGVPVPKNKEDNTVADFEQDFLSFIHAQNEKENYVVSPLSFRAALILRRRRFNTRAIA